MGADMRCWSGCHPPCEQVMRPCASSHCQIVTQVRRYKICVRDRWTKAHVELEESYVNSTVIETEGPAGSLEESDMIAQM